MIRSVALPELLVMFTVLAFPFLVVPFWKIFSKAGYPGIMGIVMLVPLLNVVMLFFSRIQRLAGPKRVDYAAPKIKIGLTTA